MESINKESIRGSIELNKQKITSLQNEFNNLLDVVIENIPKKKVKKLGMDFIKKEGSWEIGGRQDKHYFIKVIYSTKMRKVSNGSPLKANMTSRSLGKIEDIGSENCKKLVELQEEINKLRALNNKLELLLRGKGTEREDVKPNWRP
jgi:hypothetical protein